MHKPTLPYLKKSYELYNTYIFPQNHACGYFLLAPRGLKFRGLRLKLFKNACSLARRNIKQPWKGLPCYKPPRCAAKILHNGTYVTYLKVGNPWMRTHSASLNSVSLKSQPCEQNKEILVAELVRTTNGFFDCQLRMFPRQGYNVYRRRQLMPHLLRFDGSFFVCGERKAT